MSNRSWKCLPHVGAQPVAAGEPQSVRMLARMPRRVHQIAAQLADILEQGAVEVADIVPEFLRGEFVADDDRAAVHQHGAGRHHAADRVIHRQAIVHAVVRAAVHQAGEPETPLQQPMVADIGGLRQSGGARGVDQERAVADMRGAAFGGGQGAGPIARDGCDRLAEIRRRSPHHAPSGSAGSPDARAPSRTHRRNSAATMICFGATRSMQCASAGPRSLVLSSATTPPTAVMPSQIAM